MLARQAGHELHFDVVSWERMVEASVEANTGNLGMMTRMFEEITDADRIQPLRRAIDFLSREKFNWNETYIATTAGVGYAGKLVGCDGDAFMMRRMTTGFSSVAQATSTQSSVVASVLNLLRPHVSVDIDSSFTSRKTHPAKATVSVEKT
jgi:hypothetical protein